VKLSEPSFSYQAISEKWWGWWNLSDL